MSVMRNRTRLKPIQAKMLKNFFAKNAFPTIDERYGLAAKIELSVEVISRWFRNRRWQHGLNRRNRSY